MIDFSLVIATYNDAPHLRRNVMRLQQYFSATNLRYEFVFVDDCSKDHTRLEISSLVTDLTRMGVKCVEAHHESNIGRGGAVTDGILASSGQIVGYIDIDLEPLHDCLLTLILDVSNHRYDVIVGRRAIANAIDKPIRVLSSYVYRWLAHLVLKLPVADTECGLKIFRREAILPILLECHDKRWFWDTEVVHRAWRRGLKVGQHWIVFFEDRTKRSTVRLIPDTWNYLKAIARYKRHLRREQNIGLAIEHYKA